MLAALAKVKTMLSVARLKASFRSCFLVTILIRLKYLFFGSFSLYSAKSKEILKLDLRVTRRYYPCTVRLMVADDQTNLI